MLDTTSTIDMTPTPAMLDYLLNARAVMDAGTGRENSFRLRGPGNEDAGYACLIRRWLDQRIGMGVYVLNAVGRRVLEECLAEIGAKAIEQSTVDSQIPDTLRQQAARPKAVPVMPGSVQWPMPRMPTPSGCLGRRFGDGVTP